MNSIGYFISLSHINKGTLNIDPRKSNHEIYEAVLCWEMEQLARSA